MVTIDHQPKAALHIQGNATEELLRQLTTLIIEIVLSPVRNGLKSHIWELFCSDLLPLSIYCVSIFSKDFKVAF